MSYPKFLIMATVVLFAIIGGTAIWKKKSARDLVRDIPPKVKTLAPITVELDLEVKEIEPQGSGPAVTALPQAVAVPKAAPSSKPLPEANRIQQLFNTGEPKLPIVETIIYKSRVLWHKGRPAWLSDYAGYYGTSRHFIARSLNGKADYFKQDVADGDRINVFRKDQDITFHLLIDISRCKLWFYYITADSSDKVLLKTYRVGLGRPNADKASGLLTPLGKYQLGNKIAIYQPKNTGIYNGEKIEMMRVFGSRWIPFEKEISGCTAPAKGLGLHGVPWSVASANGSLQEDRESLGKYESDGCIRLATEDIEEIYAIIITKPTVVELVTDFYESADSSELY